MRVLTTIFILLALVACNPLKSTDEMFIDHCVTKLNRLLKSPVSFEMVSHTPIEVRDATLREYLTEANDNVHRFNSVPGNLDSGLAGLRNHRIKEFNDAAPKSPMKHFSTVLTYDAANSYGLILRYSIECAYSTDSRRSFDAIAKVDAPSSELTLNGITSFDYAKGRHR